jgi:hypothetical protein
MGGTFVIGGDDDAADVGLHLIDAGEVLEDPRTHFPLRDGLSRVARSVGHVSGGGGEIEGSGGETFLVHAIEQHRQADPVETDAGVFRRPFEPFFAVGRRSSPRVAARDHDNLGVNVDSEFHRSRVNDRAILGGEADAGAGQRGLHCAADEQRAGANGGNNLPHDSCPRHSVSLSLRFAGRFVGHAPLMALSGLKLSGSTGFNNAKQLSRSKDCDASVA